MSKLRDAYLIEQLASELIHLKKDRYLDEMLQVKNWSYGIDYGNEDETVEVEVEIQDLDDLPLEGKRRP